MPEDTPTTTQPAAEVEASENADLDTSLESIEKSLVDGNPVLIRQAYDLALIQHPTNVIDAILFL